MELREVIINYLDSHNLSAREFAQKCGVSNTLVSNIIRGMNSKGEKSNPTINTASKMAKGMGITIDELMLMTSEQLYSIDRVRFEDEELLNKISTLSAEDKQAVRQYIDFLISRRAVMQ